MVRVMCEENKELELNEEDTIEGLSKEQLIELVYNLLNQKDKEIQIGTDELETISHIGRSFTETLSLEKLIIHVHEQLSKMMDTTVLAITEVNEEKNCLDYLIYLVQS